MSVKMFRGSAALLALAIGVSCSGAALAQQSATRTSAFACDASSGLLTQEVIEPNTTALRLQTDLDMERLREEQVVELDEERKAQMVSNLLVVLCSERSVQSLRRRGYRHVLAPQLQRMVQPEPELPQPTEVRRRSHAATAWDDRSVREVL